MSQPKVIFVILNWNQYKNTLECLDSLMKIDYDNFDIVVVDNGSSDNSVSIIKERFPDVYIIENKKNLGASEGKNVGVRFSLRENPDYIFFLDNDTTVDKDILKELIKVMDSDSRIGLVAPMIYYYDKRETIWMAGGGLIDCWRGKFYDLKEGQIDNGQFKMRNLDIVPEGFSFVKKEIFQKIGLWDPDFFFYYENGVWNTKIKRQGYRIVLSPKAKVWHKVSFSQGRESSDFYYYRTRNRLLFMLKNAPKLYLPFFFLYFIYDFFYHILLTLYLSKKSKQLRAALIGVLDFIRGRFGERRLRDELIERPLSITFAQRIIAESKNFFIILFRNLKFLFKRLFRLKLKILINMEWNLGDEIIVLPVYKAIKSKYPKSMVNVRVKYPELLYNNPFVDEVNGKLNRYDKIFNLKGEDRAINRLDYLSKKLRIEIVDRIPKVYIKENERDDILTDFLQDRLKIAISTGAHWKSRQWGVDNFKMIAEHLVRKYGAQIIEIGKDRSSIGLGINLIGKTSIRQTALILKRSNLFIGNDTGLVHLALAVGIPTIALFGPLNPYKLIESQNNFYPVWSKADCRGCWSDNQMIYPDVCPKGLADCMKKIELDKVIELADRLLKNE